MITAVAPLAKARLAAEIAATYVRVRITLRGAELPATVAALRRRRSPAPPRLLADPARDGARLGAAVTRTLGALPADSRCLMQSLVLLTLLSRRGADPQLVIAVRPGGPLELSAHAWVELDGRPLLHPGTPDYGRLVTL